MEDPADDPTEFPDENFRSLFDRAKAAGIPYRQRQSSFRKGEHTFWTAELDMPRGNGVRTIRISDHDLKRFLKFPFEDYRFSSTYVAIFDTTTGAVEAALTTSFAIYAGVGLTTIWELPGVEVDDNSPLRNPDSIEVFDMPTGWRLRVDGESIEMEVSPASDAFLAFQSRQISTSRLTLKVKHQAGASGPRADKLLEGHAEDFLLDLELKYHTGFTLARALDGALFAEFGESPSSLVPSFPKLQYQPEARAFYWYGVSAESFPLLRYLAFYQVLEFFFASFSRRAALSRVRAQLKDPAFDPRDDRALSILIDSTKTAHAGLKREAEQLEDTIMDCVEPEALRSFIRSQQPRVDHFLGAKQPIKGTRPLRLDDEDQEIRSQVADRVYRIRNRIVHTKQVAEESGLELLLPTSEETRFLGPEVELVRWLAQRALIHGARER